MMPEAEDSLIRKAIAGDTDALSALLQVHGPVVERTLSLDKTWQRVLDTADVMQITYLEAFIRIRSFNPDGGASFTTWLRRVAENNLKDAIRELTRQKRPSPQNQVTPSAREDSMVGLYDLLGMTSTTPSRQVGRQEICSVLESAIAALPEDYARVIRMYDLEGTPIADVAKQLGRSPGAVHMLRARAHDLLRETLGGASLYFGPGGA